MPNKNLSTADGSIESHASQSTENDQREFRASQNTEGRQEESKAGSSTESHASQITENREGRQEEPTADGLKESCDPQSTEQRSALLITGAGGYIGRLLLRALAKEPGGFHTIVAMDIRIPDPPERIDGITYLQQDIRDPSIEGVFARYKIDTLVHLASIVTPPKGMDRAFQYAVDVEGTKHIVRAFLAHQGKKLIVTSSGAAYGYHPDNPPLLTEDCTLRGNQVFAYSDHKRLVEEYLAQVRAQSPQLRQLILRPGTILGASVSNQITDIFEKPIITGLKGSTVPFQFVWDQDVVQALLLGIHTPKTGIYNLIGDGILTLREIATLLQKPYVAIPPALLERSLSHLKRWNLTQYGPEQILFLKHRPVLSNERLKRDFGYTPQKTSREVFFLYLQSKKSTSPHLPAASASSSKNSTSSAASASSSKQHASSAASASSSKQHAPFAASASSSKQHAPFAASASKVIVITGAAGGIGRALALRFGQPNHCLALLDIDETGLIETSRWVAEQGSEVLTYPCDIRDLSACQRTFDAIIGHWGHIDILINNAGITHRSLLSETRAEVLHRVMDVNFFGAVHCTQCALPSLKARKGTIATISSIAGFAPLVGRTGYAASKHALHGFFDSLRAELEGAGVHVLLVCPSFTQTAIEQNALSGNGQRTQSKIRETIGQIASPEQLADAIAIEQRQDLLLPSALSKMSYLLSRIAPPLYTRIMRAKQGKEFGLS